VIHFEGDRSFSQSAARVFARLGDASFLVSCVKDVEEVVAAGADQAIWKLRPGFSFVRGTLEITLDVVERVPDSSVKVKLFSRGIGATTTVESVLLIRANDAAASVHWSADVTQMTGLLKLVPVGLMTSAAGKVIEDTWTEIEKKMD